VNLQSQERDVRQRPTTAIEAEVGAPRLEGRTVLSGLLLSIPSISLGPQDQVSKGNTHPIWAGNPAIGGLPFPMPFGSVGSARAPSIARSKGLRCFILGDGRHAQPSSFGAAAVRVEAGRRTIPV
jgi:hypothetical protein